MRNNWRPWAATAIFSSSYFPLSLVLLIQDINSDAVSKITSDKIELLAHMLSTDFLNGLSFGFSGAMKLFKNPCVSLTITIICFISIFLLRLAISSIEGGENIKVIKSLKNPTDLMNYTVPYMVAFIGVDLGDAPKVAGFVCFMVFMFILTYKSKQLFMNPILAVFGYSLYDVDYTINTCARSARILSKQDLIPDTHYRLLHLASLPIITSKIQTGDDEE